MRKGNYYRLKSGIGTLCFRVLAIHHTSEDYIKIKVNWFIEKTGHWWGNSYGMPRNWKVTKKNLESFEQFNPEWIASGVASIKYQ